MRQENADARQNKNSRCDIQHPTSPEARPYTRYMHSPIELRARCQHDSVRSGKGVVGWPRQSVASRGSSAGPRSRASVAESMTKPRQPNDAGLTVPCQVHALAPIRCRRPVDNSVQNCGARTKAQGFHRSRVRLCEIGSIACARKNAGASQKQCGHY